MNLGVLRCWASVSVLLLGAVLAHGREATAADLLYRVGDQAAREAFEAGDQDESEAAQLWRQWATRYWNHADQLRERPMPLGQYLNGNINFNRRAAAQAAEAGNERAARFHEASARFWNDILQQLAEGEKPQIRFPKREMLTPIAGLQGTPWENMGRGGSIGGQRGAPGGGGNNRGGGVSDPIPRPNYQWLHGHRYTETAMGELIAWYRRQKHMSREEQDRQISEARKRNEDDERSETEWIKLTIGGGK